MADIRALLRDELASRRSGDLASDKTVGVKASKKRKFDSQQEDVRKKSRPAAQVATDDSHEAAEQQDIVPETVPTESERNAEEPSTLIRDEESTAGNSELHFVDEDEWAAFEREVAAPSRLPPSVPSALDSNATISAAPVSAAELAAREEEDTRTRTDVREEEASGEKEDAARLLEEEFEEMDKLEWRVKRLKEKRDLIQKLREMEGIKGEKEVANDEHQSEDRQNSETDNEEEDEGWDPWQFP